MSRIILISAVNECTIDHHLIYFSWVDRMELPRPQPMILPQGQDAKATLSRLSPGAIDLADRRHSSLHASQTSAITKT
jgi:hypothetical protein